MRTAKAQIRLRGCAVWSEPSLSAKRIIWHYRMYQWRANAWMKLCMLGMTMNLCILRMFEDTFSLDVAYIVLPYSCSATKRLFIRIKFALIIRSLSLLVISFRSDGSFVGMSHNSKSITRADCSNHLMFNVGQDPISHIRANMLPTSSLRIHTLRYGAFVRLQNPWRLSTVLYG